MTTLAFDMVGPPGRTGYRPGDLVSGLVYINLSPDTAQHAQRIDVAFSGRSEIDCKQYERENWAPWQGNARTIFFDEVQKICVFDETHLPIIGTSQWPFSFVFPSESSLNPSESMRRWRTLVTLPNYPSEPGLLLPPSYNDDWPDTYGAIHSVGKKTVNIVYELEARLVSAQGSYLVHNVRNLPFVPYSRLPAPRPEFYIREHPVTCESRQLLPGSDKSFGFRAKSLMQKAPVSAFKIITELPKYCIMGDPLSVYLGIDYDLEKSTVSDLPPVFLKDVRIGFAEQVLLGMRQPLYSTDKIYIIQRPPVQQYIYHKFEKDRMPQVTERMALSRHVPLDELITDHLSFETPNIRRYYHEIYITISITCANNTFVVSARGYGTQITFIPPTKPPSGIELPDLRLMPSEAQSEALYEVEGQAQSNELSGQPIYEL